jgi:CRP-like cAMP-binding protein
MASEMRFQAGDLIFKEGDRSSLFYLLVSGNVALEVMASGHPVRITTLYAGEALGWSSVTRSGAKQFQARALEDVYALGFDGARLAHACEDDYALGFWFMRAIVNLMSDRLQAVRSQLVDSYTPVAAVAEA